jgi:hypothetical protein
VRRRILLLVLVAATAACTGDDEPAATTSATPATTPSTVTTTTTTTDPTRLCREIGEDAADLLENIVEELEDVDAAVLIDRDSWPRGLMELQADGEELDRRAAEAGCDPGAIQARALEEVAGSEPDGRAAEMLLDLLGADPSEP